MRSPVPLLSAFLLSFSLLLPATSAFAKDPVFTGTFGSLAVSGYDPVAYFKESKPVEGRSDHELEWNGATWRFANQDNLAAFKQNPQDFAPQFSGYCAWAVSQGYTASTDPAAWRIVDGKLYLNYSKGVQKMWQEDIPANIAKGDRNWPAVLK